MCTDKCIKASSTGELQLDDMKMSNKEPAMKHFKASSSTGELQLDGMKMSTEESAMRGLKASSSTSILQPDDMKMLTKASSSTGGLQLDHMRGTFYRNGPRPKSQWYFDSVMFYNAYTLQEKFDDLDGRVPMGCHAKDLALEIGESVVSLSSWIGDDLLFACSGLIIGWDGVNATILTSATLFTSKKKGSEASKTTKYKCRTMEENLEWDGEHPHYLFYNMAVIEIKLNKEPRVVKLDLGGWPSLGEEVLSVGRHYEHAELMGSLGIILPKKAKFPCELPTSNCKTTKTGIGGPLVSTHTRRVIGINFYGVFGTPFLPTDIILRCLKHLELYSKVCRLTLGVHLKDLADVGLDELAKLQHQNIHGVRVVNVEEKSPAEVAGIKVKDIIAAFDGIPVRSILKLCALQLDVAGKFFDIHPENQRKEFEVKVLVIKEEVNHWMTVSFPCLHHGDVFDALSLNLEHRWELPKEHQEYISSIPY